MSQAMNGADTSAGLALTVALDAQKIAEEASAKAAVIGADSATALEQVGFGVWVQGQVKEQLRRQLQC